LRTKPTIFLNGNDGALPNEPGLGLGEDDYKFLVDSMVAAVDGDGELGLCARLEGVKVAGKMGTIQSFEGGERRKLVWFTCFAPADDPRIAVTAMVQEKSKGDSHWKERNAMAVAGEILGEYFSKNELLKTAAPIDSAPFVDGNEISKGDSQWQGGGSD
jgi:cell division protein FtsI/penicillin-binding protein 2